MAFKHLKWRYCAVALLLLSLCNSVHAQKIERNRFQAKIERIKDSPAKDFEKALSIYQLLLENKESLDFDVIWSFKPYEEMEQIIFQALQNAPLSATDAGNLKRLLYIIKYRVFLKKMRRPNIKVDDRDVQALAQSFATAFEDKKAIYTDVQIDQDIDIRPIWENIIGTALFFKNDEGFSELIHALSTVFAAYPNKVIANQLSEEITEYLKEY